MLPLVDPKPPKPYRVAVVFPIALSPPAPPLARTKTELVVLDELNHESPPATVVSLTEELFVPPTPTLM